MEELSQKAELASKLKDEVDELKQMSEKLNKAEQVIEKYKKKVEESGDFKRQIKLMEDDLIAMREKNEHLEEAYKKLSLSKQQAIGSSQKDQQTALKNAQEDHSASASQWQRIITEQQGQISQLEDEKTLLEDQLQDLKDRLQEIEISGNLHESVAYLLNT